MNDFDPFFIVGCDRSGTTLLAALLDRHSQLAVPPETHFFRHVFDRDDETAATSATHEHWLAKFEAAERTADMRLDPVALAARFARYAPTAPELFRAAMEEYAAARGKTRAGEKTPGHLKHVPRILQHFPSARVICITRDGRDVVLSLQKMPWIHNDPRRHCLRWIGATRRVLKFKDRYPRNVSTVFFEDLLREPARELTRLCDFLGVAFEPRQLDPGVDTGVVPAWEKDWKEKAHETIDPSRIGAWARTATPEQKWLMNSMMGAELRRMGYPDTGLEGCPLPTRARLWLMAARYRLFDKP